MLDVAKYHNINEVLKAYPEAEWFKIFSIYISQISDLISQSIGWENKEVAWKKYEEKITEVLFLNKIKPILPKLLIKFIDVVRKDYEV